ncbi:MAG: hypothetical protein AAF635_10070 [Cyanobacteria bacterium P01_C01_bin.69]
MPILNYTTKIPASKTVGEIQAILAKAGAKSVAIDFDNGEPIAVTFAITLKSEFINYRLPSNPDGVYNALCREPKVTRAQRTKEQARRVAWRIVKDWVEAQLAVIEAGLATLPEVFFQYAIAPNGQTLYQIAEQHGLKALTGSR